MNKTVVEVPEGISYLSEWKEFAISIPQKHFILNKKICGCGATEAFIRSSDTRVILASPRKHLLYNKYSQHLDDNVFLYRYNGDVEEYFKYHGELKSEEAIRKEKEKAKKYIEDLEMYVSSGGNKILVTYDALPTVTSVLVSKFGSCNGWTVVVDEFQSMFYDAFYKATVEENLCDTLDYYKQVVYLSATPFLDIYLDEIDIFKDIPIVELKWPDDMIEKPEVITKKLNKPIIVKCTELIKKYQEGNGYYEMIDGEMVTAKEAVFYLNNVADICRIIIKNNLKPKDVNIICSDTPRNRRIVGSMKRRSISNYKYKIGSIPAKGEPHKMFTFCTSTVYIGADFYSTSSYAYVFANPYIGSMAVDVTIDLQQILGRERLKENPFRGKATLFYTLNGSCQTTEDAKKLFNKKIEETEARIENFNCVPNKDVQAHDLEKAIQAEGHLIHYACIKKDRKGNPIEIVNSDLLRMADIRAWEIINQIYNDDFSVYYVLRSTMSVRREVDSDKPEVQKMMNDWLIDNNFSRKAKLFCFWAEKCPELLNECNFIEHKFRNYFTMIGKEGFEKSSWKECVIKNDIRACLENNQFTRDQWKKKVSIKVYNELIKLVGPSRGEIKDTIKQVYDEENIKENPTASDVNEFFTCKRSDLITNKNTRKDTFKIVSPYRKMVSVFPNIKDPNTMINKDIDSVLEEIKNEKYKTEIEGVRNGIVDKTTLPGVCYNGTFIKRCKSGIDIYSSFLALDIDVIKSDDRMNEIKQFLTTIPYVYSYFISPSGKGLKVIILHDNFNYIDHEELYSQILGEFKDIPELDTCTRDLARCNFISSDPSLYLNPSPQPYQFIPSQDKPIISKESHYVGKYGEEITDDEETTGFLNKLHKILVSDEEILRILGKRWKVTTKEGERNNKSLAYASVLCRAGIDKNKAYNFLVSYFPGFDITEQVNYAYKNNLLGSDRIKFIHRNK